MAYTDVQMSDVMFVRFSDLGVPDPAGWRRSHSKVYDYNTNAGSFYYQVSPGSSAGPGLSPCDSRSADVGVYREEGDHGPGPVPRHTEERCSLQDDRGARQLCGLRQEDQGRRPLGGLEAGELPGGVQSQADQTEEHQDW